MLIFKPQLFLTTKNTKTVADQGFPVGGGVDPLRGGADPLGGTDLLGGGADLGGNL